MRLSPDLQDVSNTIGTDLTAISAPSLKPGVDSVEGHKFMWVELLQKATEQSFLDYWSADMWTVIAAQPCDLVLNDYN